MKKRRLDEILIERNEASDKNGAFIIVTEGRVFVDGQRAVSPGQPVKEGAKVEVRRGNEYVGRAAHKLEAALKEFKIDVAGKTCADIGAATGGFTEVLLKYGAKKVYAIDTARGKLELRIREDPRVVVMEGTDFRDLEGLPEEANCVTIDVSLVSLRNILSTLKAGRFLTKGGEVAALFKPQYETRDGAMLKHGIVQGDFHERLMHEFTEWAVSSGWQVLGTMVSPIKGGKGNTEYLIHLTL